MRKFSILLLGAFFIMMVLVMFSGCITQKKCAAKFPPEVITKTEHTKETIIRDSLLPGSVIREFIPYRKDSIINVDRWITVTDKKGLAELRYQLDSLGNVRNIECEANSRLVEKLSQYVSDKSSQEKKTTVKIKETPWYNYLIFGVLISIILYLLFRRYF